MNLLDMNSRQKINVTIILITVIFLLIILFHQKVFLPKLQREALNHYHEWIYKIDEDFILETNFIIKSREYKKEEKYSIHEIIVEKIKDSSEVTNNNFLSDSMKFSLSKVMDNVYKWKNEERHVALVSEEEIIWSSWKLTPQNTAKIIYLTNEAEVQEQELLPDKIIIGGEEYYVFAISDKVAETKHIQILGLVSVKEFNQGVSALPIRSISYLTTILIFCLLLMPTLKMVVIQKNEELSFNDYRYIIASVLLGSFLTGAVWGLISFKNQDKELFEKRLKESTNNIGNYFEQELERATGLLAESRPLIQSNKLGYFMEKSHEDSNIDITSIYLMDKTGKEIGAWSKRPSISLGQYAQRNYFKAFNQPGYHLRTISKEQPKNSHTNVLKISCRDSMFKRTDIDTSKKSLEVNPSWNSLEDTDNFFLQTISSLVDGTVKNVISMKQGEDVIACSFTMKKMLNIVHPPGYKYVVFDREGDLYFYSNISEIENNDIFSFFENPQDFLWELNHLKDSLSTFKVQGIKSYCYIKELDKFPDLFVMACCTSKLRHETFGQAWIKALFTFLVVAILVFIVIFKLKLNKWNLKHWLILPVVISACGAFVALYFCQYETKQLEVWTMHESDIEANKKPEPFKVFDICEQKDSVLVMKELPDFWNCLYFPYTITKNAKQYRRLINEPDYVISKGNKVTLEDQPDKVIKVAKIFVTERIVPFLIVILGMIIYSVWFRYFFIIPRKIRKIEQESINTESFEASWKKLNPNEKYFMFDLAEDGIANLKNKEALQTLFQLGFLVKKKENCQPEIARKIKEQVVDLMKNDKEHKKPQVRKGNWGKTELPLLLSIFGIMVLMSVFQENWLNSFIGVVTLITAGIGAINKLIKEIKSSKEEITQ